MNLMRLEALAGEPAMASICLLVVGIGIIVHPSAARMLRSYFTKARTLESCSLCDFCDLFLGNLEQRQGVVLTASGLPIAVLCGEFFLLLLFVQDDSVINADNIH